MPKPIIFRLQRLKAGSGKPPLIDSLPSNGGFAPGTPFFQEDWPPLPLSTRPPAELFVNLSNLVTPAPFSQLDWPVFRQLQPHGQDQVVIGALRLPVAVPVPFNQEDWPAQQRLIAKDEEIQRGAIRLPTVAPFVQEDWPPRLQRPVYQQSVARQIVEVVGNVQRGTLMSSAARPRILLPDQPPNSLLLLGAVPAPFSQDDWQGQRRVIVKGDEIQRGAIRFPAAPFVQEDWPQFLQRPIYQQTVGRQIAEVVGQVQRGGALVSATARPRILLPDQSVNLLPLHGTALAVPFVQEDWPTPRQAKPAQWDISGGQALKANPVFREPVSGPAPKLKFGQPDQVVNRLALTTTQPVPFVQTDWPVGRQPQIHGADQVAVGSLRFPVEQAVLPFRQADWQNPLPPKPLRTQTQYRQDGQPAAAKTTPFEATVWTIPPQKRPTALDDEVQRGAIRLPAGVVAVPFKPVDWPMPAKQARPASDQPSAGAIRFPAAAAAPFGQDDWPVITAKRPAAAELYVNLTPLTPQAPFSQPNWPPVSRLRRLVQSEIVVNRLPLSSLGGARPFVPPAWMLPLRARRTDDAGLLDNPLLPGRRAGTVTSQGGSGIDTVARLAEAAAAARGAENTAAARGANTVADDRIAGTPATGRGPGTTATPR